MRRRSRSRSGHRRGGSSGGAREDRGRGSSRSGGGEGWPSGGGGGSSGSDAWPSAAYGAYGGGSGYGAPPGAYGNAGAGGAWGWPGYGHGGYGAWPGQSSGQGSGEVDKDKDKKKKKKKKKKKRGCSGSSSSSSSSSSAGAAWRQKVWQNQQSWQGMWPPQMGGQMPPPPGPMGQWPGAPGWPEAGPGGCWPMGHEGDPFGKGYGKGYGKGEEAARNEEPEDVQIFLEPAIEEMVPVPKALLGKVIGKQAQTIIEIREKSGAFKVDARDQSSDPCQVKVAGTAEAVKKAKELIMELVETTRNKHSSSDYVEIPRAKIGMVIGLKGAQVNEIQLQTNTKIDVNFDSDPCKCYIKGKPADTAKAKQVLLTIAMQIEDDSSEYVDLPKSVSGAIIGSQGTRIRDFQDQSGARIDIDKTGAKCRVRLTGTKDQVALAKALIMAEIEKAIAPQPQRPALTHGGGFNQPMVIPAHQPTTFPATLAESIARAKAAALAYKSGLIPPAPPPGAHGDPSGFGGLALPPPPGGGAVPPPPPPTGGGQYQPW
eukprot:TRINITY_DN102574_c0_g1_i1.p1 TRINITY_DN102574_c0_g1~~TRINITY_DN102574_c0_g1_i1.p1  ORF type:complete len:541 (+),score=132.62 TRINITY_DN102574_c0_g1_i1:132-1754(+)